MLLSIQVLILQILQMSSATKLRNMKEKLNHSVSWRLSLQQFNYLLLPHHSSCVGPSELCHCGVLAVDSWI